MAERLSRRLFDICVALATLTLLAPLFTVACARAAACRMPVLLHRPVTTASGRTYRRFYFSRLRRAAALPALFNLLKGDMTIDINIHVNIKDK